MARHRSTHPAPRPKLLDSIYLLLSALAIVGALIAFIVLQNAYDNAPWMPHGDRAKQLTFAVVGFGGSAFYLYAARQSRRLQRMFSGSRYQRSLERLITPPWISTTMSVIGFAVGIYFMVLFATNSRIKMNSMSDLFQFSLGIVLVVSGVLLLRPTTLAKREAPLTRAGMIFGLFFPALLIASGIGRCIITGWRLIR
jgi:hypothetical protein